MAPSVLNLKNLSLWCGKESQLSYAPNHLIGAGVWHDYLLYTWILSFLWETQLAACISDSSGVVICWGHKTVNQLTKLSTKDLPICRRMRLLSLLRPSSNPLYEAPYIGFQELSSSSWAKGKKEETTIHAIKMTIWMLRVYSTITVSFHGKWPHTPLSVWYSNTQLATWYRRIGKGHKRKIDRHMSPHERTCIHLIIALPLCGHARWNLKRILLGVGIMTCHSKYIASIFLDEFDTCKYTSVCMYSTCTRQCHPRLTRRARYDDTLINSVVVLDEGFA